ncbi:MAG TPA: Rrf2 family transcriptional regulator [Feifaniaceae bacterium]|nr:Rrf2 family transcriptional regulator [Feifaniaceae bacterium]
MTGEFGVAIHALVFLNRKQSIICSDLLAKSVCTNPARVRKVLSKLKAAKLVGAKEGPEGGYFMVLPAEDITLDRVLFALNLEVVSGIYGGADTDAKCAVASGMADAMEALRVSLNDRCTKYLKTVTVADIDAEIPRSLKSMKAGAPE